MPTALIVNGYRFYFYAGDKSEPVHVHVEKGDGVGKIWLEPSLMPQYFDRFKAKEKKDILKIVTDNQELLKAKWHEFFY